MEPSTTWARHLVEVDASFCRTGRKRTGDVGPTAAMGPGSPYSVCQRPDGCVDETCQQFYGGQVIAKVLSSAMCEFNQRLLDEVTDVVVSVSAVVGVTRVIRPQ